MLNDLRLFGPLEVRQPLVSWTFRRRLAPVRFQSPLGISEAMRRVLAAVSAVSASLASSTLLNLKPVPLLGGRLGLRSARIGDGAGF